MITAALGFPYGNREDAWRNVIWVTTLFKKNSFSTNMPLNTCYRNHNGHVDVYKTI